MARGIYTPEYMESWIRGVIADDGHEFSMRPALTCARADTDVEVIADGLAWLLQRHPYALARLEARGRPPRAIRALARRLEGLLHTGSDDARRLAICLHAILDVTSEDEALVRQWKQATRTFHACNEHLGRARPNRAKLAFIVDDPRSVAAVQALARTTLEPIGAVVPVLAMDGSAASLPLLEQRIREALQRDERRELWMLQDLRAHAGSDGARALIDLVDRHLKTETATRIMIEWFGTPSEDLDLSFVLRARPRPEKPMVTLLVHVSNELFTLALSEEDGGRATTVRKVSDDPMTIRAERDDFALGACLPIELPTFLQRAAERIGIEWDHDGCQLEAGTRAQAVARWLRTGELPSRKSGLDPTYYARG